MDDTTAAMQEISELQHAIETLEAQRALLGDIVVNAALAPMRDRLRDLQAQTASEQRRLVTILFADLVDFTILTRRLDAEDVREVVNAYFAHWTAAIERHNGVVEKFAGDAVMAVFGLIHSTDLDPVQAVRAALSMGRELDLLNQRLEPQYGVRLQMRTGIHTGHAIVSTLRERRGQDFVVVGDSVNLASRLQALAPINGIVVSSSTYQHVNRQFEVQPFPPAQLKGFEQPLAFYAIVKERSHVALAPDSASALAPLIGRDDVFAALHTAWRRMYEGQSGRIIVLAAEPGLGKSRLMLEFERWLRQGSEQVHLFVGRSLPAQRDVPYGLLRDLFAQQFGIQDSDAPEVAEDKLRAALHPMLPGHPHAAALIGRLLGFTSGADGAELNAVQDPEVLKNQAVARIADYFAALASDRALAILIEDLHWADESSLDLLSRLNETLEHQRVLVICSARPELGERRPAWRSDTAYVQWIDLDHLSQSDSRRLLLALLEPMAAIPPLLVEQVTAAAEGNPFFVEELVKVLIEDGVIDATVRPWVVDEARLAQVRLPQTLTGVLQARLDGLQPDSRAALQQASVFGRVFWDDAIEYLQHKAEKGARTDVRQALTLLSERELVFARETSSFGQAQEYLFKHALMRDVAYGNVLRRARRTYHFLAAQWLEEVTQRSRRSAEFAALIAGHYDAAEEAAPAAHWYTQAGRQAARTFANAEALSAYGRALDLLPSQLLPQLWSVLAERERVYDLLGRRAEQAADLDQMEAIAVQLQDGGCSAETLLRRSQLALAQGVYATATSSAQRAAELAQVHSEAKIQAAAWLQLGQVMLRQGEYAPALEQMRSAWRLAERAGDRSLRADSLHGQAMAQVFLGDLDAAQQSFEAALAEAIAVGNRRLECVLLNRLSWVPTSRNDFGLAVRYAEQSLALSREIGDRMTEANALTNIGNAYIQIGNFERGDRYTKDAIALYRLLGDPAGEGAALDNLGNSAWGSGDFVTALLCKQEALEITRRIGDRQTENNILGNLGIVACDMGDAPAAYNYLVEALALAREDGNRSIESTVLAHLSTVCLRLGDVQAAQNYAQSALDLARDLNAPRDEINALNALGCAYLALGEAGQALQIHQIEETLSEQLGLHDYAAGATARQALSLLMLGDLSGALERAGAVLAVIDQLDSSSIYAPADIYLACSRVLLAVGDPRIDTVLTKAHAWLQQHLDRLGAEEYRRSFIDNIPAHAELMQAWQGRQLQVAKS
jgi:predicted ATPase/class 3 adenylate cyclase